MYKRLVLATCLMAWLWWPGGALAIDCTATMGDVQFGNVNVLTSAGAEVTGYVTVQCTNMTTPSARVCLSFGTPGGGSQDNRAMGGQTAVKLSYNIYTNSSYGAVWGSVYATPSMPRQLDVGMDSYGKATTTVPYFARILGPQTSVPPGNYSIVYSTNDTAIHMQGYSGVPPQCSYTLQQGPSWMFAVRANVVSDCSITARDIDFGQLGLSANPIQATGSVTVTCTAGTPYTVAINAGNGSGATPASRKLTREGGAETLNYGLYRDAGYSVPWGDGSAGTSMADGTGDGSPRVHQVYARLPSQPVGPPGVYRDTLIVTVTY